jgi:hypothetical protein
MEMSPPAPSRTRRTLPRYAPGVKLERSMRGASAGAVAAVVWAAQQPLDKRVFDSDYDDVELLGKLVTRRREWPAAGLALHMQNGAVFGAAYALLKPFLPGPPAARGMVAAMLENVGSWPLAVLVDRYHPARRDLEPLWGNRRAFAQATWRHLLFGALLGALEQRLNARVGDSEPPLVPVASNGHGNLEAAAVATA